MGRCLDRDSGLQRSPDHPGPGAEGTGTLSAVIVVDDGSTDATAQQLMGSACHAASTASEQGQSRLPSRWHLPKRGRQGASCVITLDGDGQHDPNDAPALLRAWRSHPDRMSIGSRLHDKAQFPPARYRANRFACFWISWAAGHPIADSQSGFRVYPHDVLRIALGRQSAQQPIHFRKRNPDRGRATRHPTLAVAIPGRYPPNARPSHFRPVVDIAKIVLMVAARLLHQKASIQ